MGSLIFMMGESVEPATSSSGANERCIIHGIRVTNAPGNSDSPALLVREDNRADDPRATATLIGALPNDYVLLVTANVLLFNDGKKGGRDKERDIPLFRGREGAETRDRRAL